MKNFVKWFGIIAFVAIIGLAFAACDLPKDDLDGTTWTTTLPEGAGTMTIEFVSPDYTLTQSVGGTSITQKGTYEISGSNVTLTAKEGGDKIKGTLSGDKLTIEGVDFKKK